MAEMSPTEMAAFHADQAIQDYAERMATATGSAVDAADSVEGRAYLIAKVKRFLKWKKTAQRQERKA